MVWWKPPDSKSFFSRKLSDYERLYSLDVLEVRDRGEDDKLDVYTEFKQNIVRDNDEVNIPWILGAKLDGTNEEQGRRRLQNMDIVLGQKEKLKVEYTHIIEEQLEEGIVERILREPTGKRVLYLPHKAVVGIEAVTTNVRMVEDAKFKVHKWESNIKELEDQNTSNPSKILGQVWDKEDNILEIKITPFSKDTPITKKTILSYPGKCMIR